MKLNYLANLKSGLCPEGCSCCSQRLGSSTGILKYTWLGPEQASQAAAAGLAGGAKRGAALTRYKPGQRSRLVYRPRRDDGRRDGRKGFAWTDYRDLLIIAHAQRGGPIVSSGTT